MLSFLASVLMRDPLIGPAVRCGRQLLPASASSSAAVAVDVVARPGGSPPTLDTLPVEMIHGESLPSTLWRPFPTCVRLC